MLGRLAGYRYPEKSEREGIALHPGLKHDKFELYQRDIKGKIMIKKWTVSNFKSIQEKTTLDIGPLTIFAGTNSSGKSTLLQSILLIAQTLSNRFPLRPVILNGPLVSLGQFNDIKSFNIKEKNIELAFSCEPPKNSIKGNIQKIACSISFYADSSPKQPGYHLTQVEPILLSTEFKIKRNDSNTSIIIRNFKKNEIDENPNIIDIRQKRRLKYIEINDEKGKKLNVGQELIGCELAHFLPRTLFCEIEQTESITQDFIYELKGIIKKDDNTIDNHYPSSYSWIENDYLFPEVLYYLLEWEEGALEEVFGFSILDDGDKARLSFTFENLKEIVEDLEPLKQEKVADILLRNDLSGYIGSAIEHWNWKREADDEVDYDILIKDYTLEEVPMPEIISHSVQYLFESFATNFRYLGPLREGPNFSYLNKYIEDPYDVGIKGENTAAVLSIGRYIPVKYIPSACFTGPEIKIETTEVRLIEAVDDWIKYIGVAHSVESQDQGKQGYELKIKMKENGPVCDLTNVGVGVSQVLPIVVMFLLAPGDATIIVEQPELHLHPSVQTRLADFFLSIALANKQCIIETHSEYIIDRIRFRIASSPIVHDDSRNKSIQDITKLYFVEKPNTITKFRPIEINEFAVMSDYPEGFFDESQKVARDILSAVSRKRNSSRDRNDE
ncbi:conserved hypothetical protein [Treponema primitia ZAS-2]|uniref:AAA domain-containing protein n=1 Tax=Treponema primitia (strain ATCC BAA-887 / DSM 12427 / ZAS-2) TaxID=545694 RepID=F5YI18_TREPZ|nr:DUF3696 domain-containing protein [Treponema primitia]AEF86889.1 conserved hypothetical protein [Treponema primitia ZAS-2]